MTIGRTGRLRRNSLLAELRRGLADWLPLAICIFVVLLSWYGYRAMMEWRRSYEMLAERRSRESADVLLKAIVRDMHAVQQSVLMSPDWGRLAAVARPYEISNFVASVFARYPYPESFLIWGADSDPTELTFFNRSDRRPPWMGVNARETKYPVVTERHAAVSRLLLDRVQKDARRMARLSAFHITLEGVPYQVVAQLNYRDIYREQLADVVAFTINLDWVRQHYFFDLTHQVWNVSGSGEQGLAFGVIDADGAQVVGSPLGEDDALTNARPFQLMFFDPDLMIDPLPDLPREPWKVQVSAAGDVALSQAISGANRTFLVGSASAFALAIFLVLAARAERTNARLTEMRSDFVSTVTHELKTPIATIRAAAETWSQNRLSGIDTFQSYGRLVMDEAKRLSRLVDNLLAYARITDIAQAYAFEPLPVGSLFKDIQQEFEAQLDEAGFDLQINLPSNVSQVRGDRLALRLLFDNLIDNAIRYSPAERRVHLTAEGSGQTVTIHVSDSGIGIPPEELHLVTQKFVRGSRAPSGGSGLGLAIAARIARDHRGALSIQSTLGEGTTVSVSLPAA
ncbi:MAG: sensor histidine kinase [Acidobacteria bacterium]|nr:MAG: sensor histidine kinase [Acidobacteriota bacterium]